jgi:hypothetical protein
MMAHHRKARGGKAVYGARLGILMLEARFPRIPGDMGNATTWPFPVLYRVVRGASPDRVVRRRAEGLLPDFLAAARELVALGADGITTNCGFLSLSPDHLLAAGAPADLPVIGTDEGREFTRAILGDEPELDVAAAEQDILEAGDRLLARHPEIGAVVLECTNMAPYARALSEQLKRPVFDIVSLVTWFHAGLAPRDFGPPASGPHPWGGG